MASEEDGGLHKIPQTAARFQCSERFVWGLIEQGELDKVHLGRRAIRITVASEDRYLERLRQREIGRHTTTAKTKTDRLTAR